MNIEITSKSNSHYKELKEVSKGNSDYIFIEGKKLFIEVVKSSSKIKKIYVDKKNSSFFSKLLPDSKHELIFMKNELLSSLFTTDSNPMNDDLIIALANKPKWNLKDLIKTKRSLIFLEKIQDPGNLGTIIRSALAFEACGVLLTKGSVSPFNTKVIRASAGAVFNMPIVIIYDLEDFVSVIRKEGYKIIATSSIAKKRLNDLNIALPSVFMFGNEGQGLSKSLLNFADEIIRIPHSEKIESLNLGVAVSILLWELCKCRGLPCQVSTEVM